jgi:hypothetical protein
LAVREDKEDEAVPRGCSLKHGQWRRGGATEVYISSDSSSAWERGRERELEREGRRCGLLRGGVITFYRGRGAPRRRWLGGNGWH